MPIVQAAFNLNDPDLYIVPKILLWEAGNSITTGSDNATQFVVPEGHFWEVERLTAATNTATEQQAKLIMRTGDHTYDSDFDSNTTEQQFDYYIGWADTPQPDAANNNPYPSSCIVFADRNLPLYMPQGTQFEVLSENQGTLQCYMAYKDYHI